MANSNLQLVVPQSIQETYNDAQRSWLWSLGDFIRYVGTRRTRVDPSYGVFGASKPSLKTP